MYVYVYIYIYIHDILMYPDTLSALETFPRSTNVVGLCCVKKT